MDLPSYFDTVVCLSEWLIFVAWNFNLVHRVVTLSKYLLARFVVAYFKENDFGCSILHTL